MNTPHSPITLIRESRPLAALPHRCSVCGLPIAIGTQYASIVIRDNDRKDRNKNLLQFKWHLPLCPRELQCTETASEGGSQGSAGKVTEGDRCGRAATFGRSHGSTSP